MAATAVLVFAGHNTLRYLLTEDGTGGKWEIPNSGGASPDLQTDTLAGPLKALATAKANGIGIVPAGGVTGAQAKAMFMAKDPSTQIGNANITVATATVTKRSGAATWVVDATVVAGNAVVYGGATAALGDAYLDITAIGAIGA